MTEVKLDGKWDDGVRFCRMGAAEYRERLARGEFDVAGQSRPGAKASPSKEMGPSAGVRPGGRVAGRVDYEEALHKCCFDWIFANENLYPELRWVFHSPNGGKRTKAQAGRFKAMGVRPGVVDILSPFPSKGGAGLAIELKAPDKPPTAKQLEFLQCSSRHGYVTGLCTTVDEFVVRARAYLGLVEIPDMGINWARWEK